MLEDVGRLFKNDPTFDYIFNQLPKGMFVAIVDKRREMMEEINKNNPLAALT